MKRWVVLGLLLATGVVVAMFCVVVLDEREQGFRTLLGAPDPLGALLIEPGPYLRVPGLQEIDVYDRRLQRYDAERQEVQLSDGKLMEVDYFVVYRIDNPQLFREQLRSEARLQSFLDDNSFGPVRDVLATVPLDALLSVRRQSVMREISDAMAENLRPRGVAVLDVRLRSTDYPEGNLPQTYQRMIKERERFARKFRAEGEEESRKVRSQADLESQVLRAEANRQASELRIGGRFHVIALDHRGHGDSPWADSYRLADYVAEAGGVIEALGLRDVVLVGHSAGSKNAFIHVAEHPERIAKLIITDMDPDAHNPGSVAMISRYKSESDEYPHVEAVVDRLRSRQPGSPEAVLRANAAALTKPAPGGGLVWKRDPNVVAQYDRPDAWAHLPRVSVPTLIVRGAESTLLTGPVARRMRDAIPDCRLVELDDGGHWAHLESPEAYERTVLDFLGS